MSELQDNNFEYQYFRKMGVHILRTYARNLGVKAPTTLKKDELIDFILKVKHGEIAPVTNKMGRKPKDTTNLKYDGIDNFDIFNPTTLNSPAYDYDIESFVTQGQVKFDEKSNPIVNITEDSGRTYNIPISEDKFTKYDLKKGDILTLEVRYLKNSVYKYNIEKFITINGIDITKYNRDSFYDLPNQYNMVDEYPTSSEFDKLFNCQKIKKGQSYFFYCDNAKNVKNLCIEYAKEVADSNTYCIILNSNSVNTIPSISDNIEVYSLNIDKSYEELNREIILVQEKVKNLVTEGKQVLFIINELEELLRIVNYTICNSVTENISPDAITAIRRLLLMAKYVNRDQNLTIVCLSTLSKTGTYKDALINNVIQHAYFYTLPKGEGYI